jgi:hypothetical protein
MLSNGMTFNLPPMMTTGPELPPGTIRGAQTKRVDADVLLRLLMAVQQDHDLREGALNRLLDKKDTSIAEQEKFNDLITKFQNSIGDDGALTKDELKAIVDGAKALGIEVDTSSLDQVMADPGYAWSSAHAEKFDKISERLERELKSVSSASSGLDSELNVGMTGYSTASRQRNEVIENIKRNNEQAKLA